MTKKKGQKRMQPATDTIAASLAKTKLRLDEERRALEISASVTDPRKFLVPDVERHLGETIYREPRITATVTLRDDPLGHMYRKGKAENRLKPAHYAAGRKFQRTYESAGIGRLRSPGDIQERVDGGGIAQGGATDRQMQAHATLADYRRILGQQGYILVRALTIDKMTLRQIAQAYFGGVSASSLKYAGWRVRECLSTLAKEMGLG